MRRKIGMTTQSTYTIEPHFIGVRNSSQEVFYIWELNTLYGCVKPEPFWAEHKHSNVCEVYFCLSQWAGLSTGGFVGDAEQCWKVFHIKSFRPNMQKLHQRNQIYFHTLTLAIEKTSLPDRSAPSLFALQVIFLLLLS